MEYRRFGRTNLNLSVLSLGTMRCLDSPQLATETINKAISLGINHLETARGYGRSEMYVGLALKSDLLLSSRSSTKLLSLFTDFLSILEIEFS